MSEKIATSVKRQGDEIELHEASLFLLVEDDVERVDDRLHSGVGAPQGDGKPGYEAEAELGVAFRREPGDLFVEKLDRAGGENARSQRKMRVDRRCVGDQSVERDERRDGGEDRQQRKEDDAARDSEQPVVVEARIDPPENVLPAPPGDLPRRGRAPSPAPSPSLGAVARRSAGRSRFAPSASCRDRLAPLGKPRRDWRFSHPPRDRSRGKACGPPRRPRPPARVRSRHAAARGGDCDKNPVAQKRPYPPTLRHPLALKEKPASASNEPASARKSRNSPPCSRQRWGLNDRRRKDAQPTNSMRTGIAGSRTRGPCLKRTGPPHERRPACLGPTQSG